MPGWERSQGIRAGPALVLAMVLVTGLLAGVLATGLASPAEVPRSVTAYATLGVSFSYSPNTISVNSQTQGMYAISGGTQPFTIWVNNTPPGCGPQTNPFTTSFRVPSPPMTAI